MWGERMNIFATSPDPWQAALWLDDVRKNKMILESAQMLSTAMRMLDYSKTNSLPIYKTTHISHPCTKWVCESRANYEWLFDHYTALGEQFGKHHKSMDLWHYFNEYLNYGSFPSENITPFANAAARKEIGVSFKHIPQTTEAYRLYLSERWPRDKRTPKWNKGEKPEWYHGL